MRVEKPRGGGGANIFNAFVINFLPRQWAKWAVGGVATGERQSCHFSSQTELFELQ